MKKFNAKNTLKASRCLSLWGNSVLSNTICVRIIKKFPKGSNQATYCFLFINENNNILMAIESYNLYCERREFEEKLPKRIAFIEDLTYLPSKDYKKYIEYSTWSNIKIKGREIEYDSLMKYCK